MKPVGYRGASAVYYFGKDGAGRTALSLWIQLRVATGSYGTNLAPSKKLTRFCSRPE